MEEEGGEAGLSAGGMRGEEVQPRLLIDGLMRRLSCSFFLDAPGRA